MEANEPENSEIASSNEKGREHLCTSSGNSKAFSKREDDSARKYPRINRERIISLSLTREGKAKESERGRDRERERG